MDLALGILAGLGLAAVAAVLVVLLSSALRLRRLELERGRRRLEGELVVANTPRPDDQSIRGVVVRELDGGGLELRAAVYLERELERGAETVREVAAGDVVLPRVAWVQVLHTGSA